MACDFKLRYCIVIDPPLREKSYCLTTSTSLFMFISKECARLEDVAPIALGHIPPTDRLSNYSGNRIM
jgi:hypothetical protein